MHTTTNERVCECKQRQKRSIHTTHSPITPLIHLHSLHKRLHMLEQSSMHTTTNTSMPHPSPRNDTGDSAATWLGVATPLPPAPWGCGAPARNTCVTGSSLCWQTIEWVRRLLFSAFPSYCSRGCKMNDSKVRYEKKVKMGHYRTYSDKYITRTGFSPIRSE